MDENYECADEMLKHTNTERCISSGIETKLRLRGPSLRDKVIRLHKGLGHYEDHV
jgi:hypothetical protein